MNISDMQKRIHNTNLGSDKWMWWLNSQTWLGKHGPSVMVENISSWELALCNQCWEGARILHTFSIKSNQYLTFKLQYLLPGHTQLMHTGSIYSSIHLAIYPSIHLLYLSISKFAFVLLKLHFCKNTVCFINSNSETEMEFKSPSTCIADLFFFFFYWFILKLF